MESNIVDAATADVLVKIGWHLGGAVVALVVGMTSALLWGRGGRKRLKERIAALQARAAMPGISQTFSFNAAANAHDRDRQLREAIEAKTTQSLTETLRSLPQMPLGDGHTYARLPDGTNIVSVADGSFRLAIPIVVHAAFEGGLRGDLNAPVRRGPASKDDDT